MTLTPELTARLLSVQRTEITSSNVYKRLAASMPPSPNRDVLEHIAKDELGHYRTLKELTGRGVSPSLSTVHFLSLLNRIFGFTFVARLLEKGEGEAQTVYGELAAQLPQMQAILNDEEKHEEELLSMLDEERLRYVSSVVLGLNDALVELTGTLAGLTLALRNVQLIALTGLITGVAASFSMAASEYLSTKAEPGQRQPLRSAAYTGLTYLATVAVLILPYLLLKNEYLCLAITLVSAVVVIAVFNYYIVVARSESFRKRFFEMAGVTMGVAALSFVFSYLIRLWLGVEV